MDPIRPAVTLSSRSTESSKEISNTPASKPVKLVTLSVAVKSLPAFTSDGALILAITFSWPITTVLLNNNKNNNPRKTKTSQPDTFLTMIHLVLRLNEVS